MKIAIIIVGIGQQEQYTIPLLKSIRKYSKELPIVLIENGSTEILSPKIIDDLGRISVVYTSEVVCYAEAINLGISKVIKLLGTDIDWWIIINNDVICTGNFISQLEKLNKNIAYTNNLHVLKRIPKISDTPLINGWLYVLPNKIVEVVGEWDTNFKIAGFEDFDYSLRIQDAGFKIEQSSLEFKHLGEHIRRTFEDYADYWQQNREYFFKKHRLNE